MTAYSTPTVTVLIPVHNRVGYIRDAIDSVLAQTFADFELLIIDDASSDGSADAVASYRDPRLRLLRNETNLGIPGSRNRGIDEARGEYLAFLDSDDRARPERLARQVAFLRDHPDHAAVGSWIEWMSQNGKPLGRIKRKAVAAEQIAAERLFRSCLENSAATARTAILRRYRHRERIKLGSDYDLWARIAADHKLAALPHVLTYRRQHGGRSTHGRSEEIKAWRLQIFAEQLGALGLPYSADDLERHYELRRMQKLPIRPDRAYLEWAQEWLQRLRAANVHTLRYPEPAFSYLLGTFWLKACWYAAPVMGRHAWRCFWASPLHTQAWPGLARLARTRFAAQLPGLSRP
ncbi:glycosyltransferase family 2 protein [Nitrococcus mobilis]|uniref:Glycosyl transferase, group 2 family protein n=1 Tax=Nitrococcus mobilis Nb-231 TaxID=314278 RepID=A4BPR7_9GAMM|nr:glycosyltransferase family 2 protein [Nitrococcus mobilis]EAR22072.1 glycosyl transferase, group 2 family protein [Nitrococcus mobilis Nb-231]